MVINGGYLKRVEPSDLVDGKFVMPNIIEHILPDAFDSCADIIEEIVFSDKVTLIRNNTFEDFTKLKSVTLPKNLKIIGNSIFKNCPALENVVFPENLTMIGDYCFQGCTSLKNITIPKTVTKIGRGAFQNCTSLENINLSEGLYEILGEAFENCSSLKEVNLPRSAIKLSPSVFANCKKLQKVQFSRFLSDIPDSCFANCVELTDVDIPEYLRGIGSSAFLNCKSLKSIYLPENLLEIEYSAFKGCESIVEMNIPNSVNVIEHSTFENCSNLKHIRLSPETIRLEIGAFKGCKNLLEIELPQNVYSIEDRVFQGCESLKTVTIPTGTVYVGSSVFDKCSSLEIAHIPDTVKTMQDNKSDSLLFFNKTKTGFDLTMTQTENSIPVTPLNIDLAFLSKFWEYKNIILKDEKNLVIADFYNTFLNSLPDEQVINFLQNHNFTFFKQLKIDPDYANDEYYKILYNLGAFETPIEINGKKVDYAQKIVGFLQEKMAKTDLDRKTIIKLFTGMQLQGFKPEFTEFFMKNYDELIAECSRNPRFLVDCYDDFEKAQKMNTSNRGSQRQLKATVESMKNYFLNSKFSGVTDENKHIAETISPYFRHQLNFDDALKILAEKKKMRTPNNILRKPLKEESVFAEIDEYALKIQSTKNNILGNLTSVADNEFTFEWLEKNDPENFILGKLCNCCAHLEGQGFSIMKASVIHPSIQTLVIRDKQGVIVAKSTLYINKKGRYGVCNNVEVAKNVSKEDKEKIYQKFILGVRAFATQYNKEHRFFPLKQINVGMHLNDLSEQLKEYRYESIELLKAIDYGKAANNPGGYMGDSYEEQYVVWTLNEDKMINSAKISPKKADDDYTVEVPNNSSLDENHNAPTNE